MKPPFSQPYNSSASKNPGIGAVCKQLTNIKPLPISRPRRNMNVKLYNLLKDFKSSDLIIKEADKGSGVVVMEKDFYLQGIQQMVNDQNTYEVVTY